jgi:hypothetical protein
MSHLSFTKLPVTIVQAMDGSLKRGILVEQYLGRVNVGYLIKLPDEGVSCGGAVEAEARG